MSDEIRVREEIINIAKSEMMGPGSEDFGGDIEYEIISDSPLDRYVTGILYPQNVKYEEEDGEKNVHVDETKINLEDIDVESAGNIENKEFLDSEYKYENDNIQEQISMTNQSIPSAIGLTFFSKGILEKLNVKISVAKYRKSTFKDCKIKISKGTDINQYYLDEFIYQDGDTIGLKKNITKKDVYELVSGRNIDEKNKEIVDKLYKLADFCTVDKKNNGYVRNPFLKNKLVSINLNKEINSIYIDEEGNENLEQGILKLIVLKKDFDNEIFSYTVVLVNEQAEGKSYEKCLFQPELRISTEDNKFILIEHSYMNRKGIGIINDEDLVYELLYRNKKSYAVGHGVAVGQNVDDRLGKGEIYTDFFPSFEVPQLEFNIEGLKDSSDVLSMFELSDLSRKNKNEKIKLLLEFSNAYENWIKESEKRIYDLDSIFEGIAKKQIERCNRTLNRIRKGIEIINTDENVYTSFVLMNRAMLMQRTHSKLSRGEYDRYPEDLEFPEFDYINTDKKSTSWRAFQLAFILMNIDGINDPNGTDRDIVDLIWIPTGGGKTEAYLGLTAFTIFLRRLKDPINYGGTTIIMRYTLRLLAAQQFVRASILICACEKIRRDLKKYKLGKEEISIGLWVGGMPTPNKNTEAKKIYKSLISTTFSKNELDNAKKKYNKFQILKCPWCGTKLEKEYVDGKEKGKWGYNYDKKKIIFCPDRRCEFSRRLPIQVVDEELYKNPPTLLFGTVDKFAALPWEGEVSKLFALEKGNNNKQPELIIQDELHLISGPLGSIVGLYETAIDAMCSNIVGEDKVKPKIIASTATIKRAKEQCKMLFNREVEQFPPAGLDIEDCFFTREIPVSQKPGRRYVGIMPTGKTPTTTQVRLYTSLIEGIKLIDTTDDIMDKYWTLVGYFNSIRELGKTSNLILDDITSNNIRFMKRLLKNNKLRYVGFPQELTSRVESTEIVKILKNLENNYTREKQEFNLRPIDVLLASNMISVGVDVSRLNLMVVSGQPKQTSEYIQASSRVGRRDPGLVFTLYNPSKTRDRSHYEMFYSYHQTFYKYVEPTSITPFSEQARERGLHSVFISMVRHLLKLNKDEDANEFSSQLENIEEIKTFILDRVKDLDQSELQDTVQETESEMNEIIDKWETKTKISTDGDSVCYKSNKNNKNLLIPYLEENPNNAFPTMQSLRNVDSEASVDIIVLGEENDE